VDLYETLTFERKIEVVDIGANPIDGAPPYKKILDMDFCNVTGFEPQNDELNKLNERKTKNERYFSAAIGNGQTINLNICRYSGWTSAFIPNPKSLDLFSVFRNNATVVKQHHIPTSRLDDIDVISNVDFLHIDIQGSELEVFRNAHKKLSNAVMIQTEVSFFPLYEGQPTFGDVDLELRKQGFVPHCFAALKTCPISPFPIEIFSKVPINQVLEADIVYVRDLREISDLSDFQLKCISFLAHSLYASFDLAYRILLALEARNSIKKTSANIYLDSLRKLLGPQNVSSLVDYKINYQFQSN
jgi:FkbM family methyltransferase